MLINEIIWQNECCPQFLSSVADHPSTGQHREQQVPTYIYGEAKVLYSEKFDTNLWQPAPRIQDLRIAIKHPILLTLPAKVDTQIGPANFTNET